MEPGTTEYKQMPDAVMKFKPVPPVKNNANSITEAACQDPGKNG
jgi:hypothetical protein